MLSHRHNRAFLPEKLTAPRDFKKPDWLASAELNQAINHASESATPPLVIEIGAGKGKHAIQYALANPTHRMIAIERTQGKFAAFKKTVDASRSDAQPNNLLPVHADAIAWAVHALLPASVDSLFILYPNPEPKNPNQQWLNMPFFEFLLSRLKAGGKIILASNIESYIDNAEQQAIITWQLPTIRFRIPSDSQRTHFEVKYLARGETCWQLELTKPTDYHTRFDTWQPQTL